jgi:hypothetical protein
MRELDFDRTDYSRHVSEQPVDNILHIILSDPGELPENFVQLEAEVYKPRNNTPRSILFNPRTSYKKMSKDKRLADNLKAQFGPSKQKFNPSVAKRKTK